MWNFHQRYLFQKFKGEDKFYSSKLGNLFLKFALNLNYLPKKMHITWKSGWNSTQGSI